MAEVSTNEFRPGLKVIIDNELCEITENDFHLITCCMIFVLKHQHHKKTIEPNPPQCKTGKNANDNDRENVL